MMKLRLFIIFFLVAFSRNECYTYAQQHSSDEKSIDIQTLISQKEKIYNKLIESYDKNDDKVEIYVYFNFIEEWYKLFSQIIYPFDTNKDISLYNKWEEYNSQIINLLDKFDFGFTHEQVIQWENECKQLKEVYFKTHGNNNIPYIQKTDPPKSLRKQNNRSNTVPRTTTNPHITNISNNKDLLDTYITCLTLPLAVKYHKDGTKMAYNALNNLIKNDFITNVEFIEMWQGYSPLLKDYEKYNNEIIKLIESHRDLAKKNELNKQLLTKIINDILSPKPNIGEYGQFYKKDWSISYLDKTIEKYINLLKEFTSGIRTIDYRAFDVFINSYLK